MGLGGTEEESRRLPGHSRSKQGEEGVLGNAMQGLHSPLPVYMEKISCRVHTGRAGSWRQKKTQDAKTQNTTGSELPLLTLRSKGGPIHADVSPREVAFHQQLFC